MKNTDSTDRLAQSWAFYVRKVKEYMQYRGPVTFNRRKRYERLLSYQAEMVRRSGYYELKREDAPPGMDKLTFRGEPMPRLHITAGITTPGGIPPRYCGHNREYVGRCMDCGDFLPGIPPECIDFWEENGPSFDWPPLKRSELHG